MILNTFKIILGLFFACLGLLIAVLEIISLIDPIGTKMADDADPFGEAYRPWYIHATYFLIAFICFGVCFLLTRNSSDDSKYIKLQ